MPARANPQRRIFYAGIAVVSSASFWSACGSEDATAVDMMDASGEASAPFCDPSKNATCVSDGTGVFVNASSGADSNTGTKEAPVKTIGAALTKASSTKPNIFICAGSYAEHVKLSSAANLVGGFACADWSYAPTNAAHVAPTDAGYALDIESVTSAITISDLEFDVQSGTSTAPSSIAAFVNASPQVIMRRASLNAGAGAKGADGSSSAGTTLARGLKGNSADGGIGGGPEQTCPCPDGNTIGGHGGSFAAGQFNGEAGQPDRDAGAPNNGVGGTGGLSTCTGFGAGGNGAPGSDGDAGISGVSTAALGTLDSNGFHPSNGGDGSAGMRGQGGGGGGATTAGGTGGGGGGCGGCGGTFGGGGQGGGASIALALFNSPVTLVGCTLLADAAADGGKGGDGQAGAQGGFAGTDPVGASCNGGIGGNGGNGGNGGAGGGGVGGISVGVVYKGDAPTIDSETQTTTKTPGHGGAPGAGGSGNGVEGVAQATLEIK